MRILIENPFLFLILSMIWFGICVIFTLINFYQNKHNWIPSFTVFAYSMLDLFGSIIILQILRLAPKALYSFPFYILFMNIIFLIILFGEIVVELKKVKCNNN